MVSIRSVSRFYVAALVAILFLSGGAVAQTDLPTKAQADSPGSNKADPNTADSTSLQDAVNAAVRTLKRLEETTNNEQFTEAVDEMNRLIEQARQADPQTPWLHYLQGRMYAATGREGDAVSQLRKFIATREGRNEWHAYQLLGDLFIREFPRLAQSNYKKAASLKSHEPAVLFGLSRCASMLGRKDEAVNLATQTVDADRAQSVQYLSHLANMLARSENWVDAQRTAENAVKLAQQQVDANPGQRRLRLELDAQIKQIIEVIYLRLSDSTNDAEIEHGFLMLADYARQRAANGSILSEFDVLDILQAGVDRMEPNIPTTLLEQYAVTLAKLGRTAEAIDRFQQLQSADPANATAADWLPRLNNSKKDSPQSDDP